MLSLEGKQLGNYDIMRPIRVGGMGAVYEGRQRTAFGRRVAIKVIHNDYATDRDMRRRFAREARTIARLHHPHILPLIEFGDEQGILYLVMPLIEGGTLTSYLRHNLPDLAEVTAIFQQLLDAVEYAHDAGLIHRDIKSSNVLLEMRRNGPPHVYLADFGLVRFIRSNDPTATGAHPIGKPIPLDQVPGTPHYMAPEQTRGIVTPLTDIYALGVLLYQLLTGALPYNDPDEIRVIQMHLSSPIPSPCDHDASIPYELDEVVRVAMAKRPDDRYQTVTEFRAAFLAAITGPAKYEIEMEAKDERRDYPNSRYFQTKTVRDDEPTFPPLLQPTPMPEPIVLQPKALPGQPKRTRDLAGQRQEQSQRLPAENTDQTHQQPEIAATLERADRVRTTDNMYEKRDDRDERQRVRHTEDQPFPLGLDSALLPAIPRTKARRRYPFIISVIAAILLIITLIIVSSVLSRNILPVVGSHQAIVQIAETPTQLQETYELTAAPQYTAPDPNKFALPARVLQSSFTDGNIAATTGQKNLNATAAQGTLFFTNTGNNPILVNDGEEFIAGAIHIRITQSILVLENNVSFTTAIAVNLGKAGNIAPQTLQALQPSFPTQVTVQNRTAFSGGADAQMVHIVTQADIDGLLTDLRKKVTQQADQQLQSQLASGEVMVNNPNRTETVTSNFQVGDQADQVQVTLKVQESVLTYKPSVAIQIATTLLNNQANRSPGPNYRSKGDITKVGDLVINDVKNNTIILSVTVHGTWVYNFNTIQTNQWRQSIKGLKLTDAQNYLKAQAGVADVHIQLPFGTDHLPTNVDSIKIEFT